MLRCWINWMPVKLWLLLKYLARHEFLERRRFKDFSVWSCETWIQSLSGKIPPCLCEVSQNQLNCWDWAELTVPLGSESKYEMLIQSWASWVALDTPPPHPTFIFLIPVNSMALFPTPRSSQWSEALDLQVDPPSQPAAVWAHGCPAQVLFQENGLSQALLLPFSMVILPQQAQDLWKHLGVVDVQDVNTEEKTKH